MAEIREHQECIYRILEEFDRICRENDIPYQLFAGSLLGAVRHSDFIPWDDDLDVIMLRKDYERFLETAPQALDCDRFFLQKEYSEHWPMFFSKLRMNGTACIEKFHPKDPKQHQGIYIDIFPCDNASDNAFVRKLQFAASKIVITKCLHRRGYDTDSRMKKIAMAVSVFLPAKPFIRLARLDRASASGYVHSCFGASHSYGKSFYKREWLTESVPHAFRTGMYPVSEHYDELLTCLYGDYHQIPADEQKALKKHAILVDTENSYEHYEHYRDDMKFRLFTRSIR